MPSKLKTMGFHPSTQFEHKYIYINPFYKIKFYY